MNQKCLTLIKEWDLILYMCKCIINVTDWSHYTFPKMMYFLLHRAVNFSEQFMSWCVTKYHFSYAWLKLINRFITGKVFIKNHWCNVSRNPNYNFSFSLAIHNRETRRASGPSWYHVVSWSFSCCILSSSSSCFFLIASSPNLWTTDFNMHYKLQTCLY